MKRIFFSFEIWNLDSGFVRVTFMVASFLEYADYPGLDVGVDWLGYFPTSGEKTDLYAHMEFIKFLKAKLN